jgi:putative aldouronate transport system substrate-binding protein
VRKEVVMRKPGKIEVVMVCALFLLGLRAVAAPQPTQKVPISMLIQLDGDTADQDNVFKNAVEQKFNVELKLEKTGSEKAIVDKLRLLLAADELPDIAAMFPAQDAKAAGVKGALVPLNKYWDKMPSFYKWMHQDPKILRNIAATDGNVYIAPRVDLYVRVNRVPIMRVDLLKKLGLKVPETFDELYTTLKAVKQAYPDNLGLISFFGDQDLSDVYWGFYFNTNAGYGQTPGMMYDRYQDKWQFGPLGPGYEEMVTFFNKLWKEKLMDPEYFTTSDKTRDEKMTKGNITALLATDDTSWKMELQNHSAYPSSTLDYEIEMPFKSKTMPELAVSRRQSINIPWSWAISAKAKNLDRILQIVDWMYSDEGSIRTTCGVEGTHFTYVQQNGSKVWKFVPDIIRDYNPSGKWDPRVKYHLRNPVTTRVVRDYYQEFQADNDLMRAHYATLNKMDKVKGYERNFDGISLTFTEDQNEQIQEIATVLQTYVDENTIGFVTGSKPLTDLAKFKAECERLGAKKLEKIYGDGYAAWKNQVVK